MNRIRRLFYSAILMLTNDNCKRISIIKKHNLYGSIGENCYIQKRKLPLYSNLVFLHNNVHIASSVGFVTHDIIHNMLNNKYRGRGGRFIEKVGCIEVMDNVFIGSGTRILYNIHIGTNVIIGSGSLVTKDIPDNSVYAGVPARFVCSFDEYVEKHRKYSEEFRNKYGRDAVKGIDEELASSIYEDFKKQRNNNL